MADDSKDLLASLTSSRLPAVPDSGTAEPQEPTERTDLETRGRSPDEVVQTREERQAVTETPAEDVEITVPAGKKPAKEKTYEVNGKKYTAAELQALEQTAEQFKAAQKQNFKLSQELEELKKATPPATTQPAQPPAPQITDERIAQVYDQFAEERLKELVAKNLVENDMAEAWPRTFKTMIGQLRFAYDLVFEHQEKIEKLVNYLSATEKERSNQIVQGKFDKHLDNLVASDARLYAGLKDNKVRDAFAKYLIEELGATLEQVTGEKAQDFLAKQWVAFNAPAIIEAAKQETKDKKTRQDKRFVIGENGGVRPASVDPGEQSLLDRLADKSGRIAQ